MDDNGSAKGTKLELHERGRNSRQADRVKRGNAEVAKTKVNDNAVKWTACFCEAIIQEADFVQSERIERWAIHKVNAREILNGQNPVSWFR